jgi:hypothetical protein
MLTRSDRLQPPVLAATTCIGFSAGFKHATSGFKKKVVLAVKDLDLLTSLYVARFIIWRTTRKRL